MVDMRPITVSRDLHANAVSAALHPQHALAQRLHQLHGHEVGLVVGKTEADLSGFEPVANGVAPQRGTVARGTRAPARGPRYGGSSRVAPGSARTPLPGARADRPIARRHGPGRSALQSCRSVTSLLRGLWEEGKPEGQRRRPLRSQRALAQLRGFALDFSESEKLFTCKSVPGLWITHVKWL